MADVPLRFIHRRIAQARHPFRLQTPEQPLRLGGVAAVAVVPAKGFELVVEVSHVRFVSGKC